ncbi:hypothetical protein BDV26DRAFT_326 [Aspergillus bertholletiae]|uniref:Uncharacterized protein n=1 Tax=Aspergillus bertholletiae TaxID=1226010 RepID=A0A5N7BPI3_9EURO|nr:hypothetical protein BDV26DRAFT_326 [Aspergillus bertholletiae]
MTTSASADPASPHHNNNSHHHIYSSPCSSPATNSDDADSIYFPRTPPPPPHRISDSNRKRKATETETDPLPYSSWVQSPSSSTSPLNNLALGVSSEQRQKIHHNHYQYDQQQLAFYPSPTTTTTSRNHPKRRCSSVIPDREAYQDQQQDQGLARDQEDIFTPLEMPDGSTRFTSNWLPVDPSGGFTICPDPLAGMTSEAFVSVGS